MQTSFHIKNVDLNFLLSLRFVSVILFVQPNALCQSFLLFLEQETSLLKRHLDYRRYIFAFNNSRQQCTNQDFQEKMRARFFHENQSTCIFNTHKSFEKKNKRSRKSPMGWVVQVAFYFMMLFFAAVHHWTRSLDLFIEFCAWRLSVRFVGFRFNHQPSQKV